MDRQNVFQYPTAEDAEAGERPLIVGWFDIDKAAVFGESTEWDGQNQRGVHVDHWADHQVLYRTTGGRWVLHVWSQRQGKAPTWKFITDKEAREWLIRDEDDDLIAKYFGKLAEESGPGRPEEGKPVSIRIPDGLRARLDERATADGVSLAEMVRRLCAAALDA
jgi:hypothetical protein